MKDAFKEALPHTIPICVGFLFIGISYGFLMSSLGFSFLFPMFTSLFIFAGSMEFVTANLLISVFNPLQAFLLTLMVNARHIFYGISMLGKYNRKGWKNTYLIFGMCDESFSINCNVEPKEGIDKEWFMFFVTLLNHSYWVIGASLGGILGTIVSFNTEGIEFVMTSLFVVIFLNQWEEAIDHIPASIGIMGSLGCLFIFGSSNFMIPTMITLLLLFMLYRKTSVEGGY